MQDLLRDYLLRSEQMIGAQNIYMHQYISELHYLNFLGNNQLRSFCKKFQFFPKITNPLRKNTIHQPSLMEDLEKSEDLNLKKSKQKLRALETRAGREIFWLKSKMTLSPTLIVLGMQ